jgi:hypothetical protein
MSRLRILLERICAYCLSRPATLAAVGTGIALPENRTTLALALSGWGWLFAGAPGALPRRRDWRFFVRPHAHVVVPDGRRIRILTRNVFGTHTLLWTPPAHVARVQPRLPAAPERVLGLRPLPDWSVFVRSAPPRIAYTRPAFRHSATPAVPKTEPISLHGRHTGPALFPALRNHLTQCSQVAGSVAAAAASSLASDHDESR